MTGSSGSIYVGESAAVRRYLRAAAFAGVACSHSIAIRRVRSSQLGGIPVSIASFAKETLGFLVFAAAVQSVQSNHVLARVLAVKPLELVYLISFAF
jgi:hypothetical protein